MNKKLPTRQTARSGFTLLELMVVIVIIAILLSLILPAIGGALRNARVAEVQAEITRLETAISSFKAEYGIEPWSEILFDEAGVWSDPMDAVRDRRLKDSRSKLRRLFPSFTFGAFDLNDNASTEDVEIEASECLVFFLGGMRSGDTLIGFSKNPLTPLSRAGTNRTTTFFEFDSGRLRDADGDGIFEYLDPTSGQTTPYHFASANNGQGYTPTTSYYVDGSGQPWKRNSHQIISPGDDAEFGPTSATPPVYTEETDLSGARLTEADNITNFSSGRLN